MLHDIISYISTLDPIVIYFVLFFFSFIENIIPPSPSDLVVVIGSALIANTAIGFIPILIVTSLASSLGFITMYLIGEFSGENIIRKGKVKFLKEEYLHKADVWFAKYGYKLILLNRFIPGTRAVISFFSGVHRLKPLRTFVFASISAFIWNVVLIYLGIALGNNIDEIDKSLNTYSHIIIGITIVIIVVIAIRFWKKKENETV